MQSASVVTGTCQLEWGWRGARLAAERRDTLVVVDVLSFSTTAVTAAMRGAVIFPCVNDSEAQRFAELYGAEIAVRRELAPDKGRFSLSPTTFLTASPGDRVALPSPNGATCCRIGAASHKVFVASLLNASAAARAAESCSAAGNVGITVLACGERWPEPTEEGQLRFALEDYLGAGAVLSALDLPCSPDAAVCRAAYRAVRNDLPRLLAGCSSGVELRDRGWLRDVEHAAQVDISNVVPTLAGDGLEGQPY